MMTMHDFGVRSEIELASGHLVDPKSEFGTADSS
jgi:hypothetical protein